MASNPLTPILTAVATAAVFSYFVKRALSSRPRSNTEGHLILTYPFVLRLPGAIVSALLAVLGASAPFWAGSDPRSTVNVAVIAVVGIGLAALGVYGAVEFPVVRIVVREDGLISRSPWRRTRFIAWSAVESVRFSPGAQWFVIRSHDGIRIRAHLYLSGIRQLYLVLKSRLPAHAWQNFYQPFEGP